MFDEGSLYEKEGDEEMAYIYFVRCCELSSLLPKCPDYQRTRDRKDVISFSLFLQKKFSEIIQFFVILVEYTKG